MINNNDDQFEDEDGFEDDDFDGEESFDDFDDGKETTLADAIREKPLFKVGIIVGVLILIFVLFAFFTGGDEPAVSSVPNPSDVAVAPGTQDVPDNIRAAIEESDEQRRELAEQTGQSAVPTLIEPPSQQLELDNNNLEEEDPLQRWRALQQERLAKEDADTRFIDQEEPDTAFSVEDIQALADAMAAQMQAILENKGEAQYASIDITPAEYLEQLKAEKEGIELDENGAPIPSTISDGQISGLTTTPNANGDVEVLEILVPAGEIAYAQLLLEANSDVQGPVLARIAGGPLSGSKAIGTFSTQNELLVLTFNTLVQDGISKPINAIAVNPSTSLTGLVSKIDRRYFTRVILPGAAAFIQGTAEAIAASGQTTITINGTGATTTQSDIDLDSDEEISAGIEEAATALGQVLQQRANNTQPLLRIYAGTPIGLLFLEPVLKEE